jgi:F-type H+-transporting ATPase subunit delta
MPSSTALRYAQAAFEVAQEDRAEDDWLSDLDMATKTLTESDLARYFKDPSVSREEQLATIDKGFADVRPHVLNLLRVLASRQRLHLLPAIRREFERLIRDSRGVTEALVVVARAVDGAESKSIEDRLVHLTGKRVEVRVMVDQSILGGIIVRVGDKLVDASVAGALQRLKQELA